MKYALAVLLLALALASSACSASIPAPNAADVDRAQQRWPTASLAELEQGRSMYRSRCGNCHTSYSPGRYSPDEWPEIVDEMRERAELTADQHDQIVRYLVTIASRPSEKKD